MEFDIEVGRVYQKLSDVHIYHLTIFTGYILLYTNDSSLPLYLWTGVFERSLQYIIKNLSFNTTYFLTIQSQVEDGSGVMSGMKIFTTRSVGMSTMLV